MKQEDDAVRQMSLNVPVCERPYNHACTALTNAGGPISSGTMYLTSKVCALQRARQVSLVMVIAKSKKSAMSTEVTPIASNQQKPYLCCVATLAG